MRDADPASGHAPGAADLSQRDVGVRRWLETGCHPARKLVVRPNLEGWLETRRGERAGWARVTAQA